MHCFLTSSLMELDGVRRKTESLSRNLKCPYTNLMELSAIRVSLRSGKRLARLARR